MRERRLDKSPHTVQYHQNEEDIVRVVREPERFEGVPPGELHGKYVDEKELDGEKNSGEPWWGEKIN